MGSLPIHGFVLAGGKSSRMGRDKALLAFRGRPMVEIAIEKLRGFCAEVSIAGNRNDLSRFAPVVGEQRCEAGPAAGIEAGLLACGQPWAMFVPVDVPLVPGELLRRWAEATLHGPEPDEHGQEGEYYSTCLQSLGVNQPAFLMARPLQASIYTEQLNRGQGRLETVRDEMRRLYNKGNAFLEAALFSPLARPTQAEMNFWFSNVNTQSELEVAELWAETWAGPAADPQ